MNGSLLTAVQEQAALQGFTLTLLDLAPGALTVTLVEFSVKVHSLG